MSLLKRWFSKQQKQRQQKQINQSDVKALMQGDLARAGIESTPYLEESPLPMPPFSWEGTRIRQDVPPGTTWERLSGFRAPHEGQWQVQTQIRFKTQKPSLSFVGTRNLLVLFEVNQESYYEGAIGNGMTKGYSRIFKLATDDVLNLYVNHDSPYSAEVEHSISFIPMDSAP